MKSFYSLVIGSILHILRQAEMNKVSSFSVSLFILLNHQILFIVVSSVVQSHSNKKISVLVVEMKNGLVNLIDVDKCKVSASRCSILKQINKLHHFCHTIIVGYSDPQCLSNFPVLISYIYMIYI